MTSKKILFVGETPGIPAEIGTMLEPRLKVRQGKSEKSDADEAVRELAEQIVQPNMRVCLVFFSDSYNPLDLGRALKEHLPGPVIGCSTAGQLTETGFLRGCISGASLAGDEIAATPYLIRPLSSQADQVREIAEDVQEKLSHSGLAGFGFLLVDGLSMKEELLITSLYMSLGDAADRRWVGGRQPAVQTDLRLPRWRTAERRGGFHLVSDFLAFPCLQAPAF